ncbi:MAG: long-chain fatty acid--CoA ligase [Candidatus Marinimicrobia bacterium]|nr:long-chain fatty acid--CoA ligase [Candidatus Neomarinimicrobiota bacterium]MDD5582468.1 long-chain fatty acid--CoA ligase [Candidatus Neomarinimicrobiota bacterium]
MLNKHKKFETLPDFFRDSLSRNPDMNVFYENKGGSWVSMTYREAAENVELIAFGLRSLGLTKGDRVGIQSENRSEWILTDYACIHFGYVSVPIYPTLLSPQIQFILHDSETSVLVVSTREQAEKILTIKESLPSLKTMIVMNEEHFEEEWILTYRELLERGRDLKKKSTTTLEEEGKKITKDDLWTIIYTSGTTGNPKGVMLTHHNIISDALCTYEVVPFERGCRWLSFLPLSHSLERASIHLIFWLGSEIYIAEDFAKVADYMKIARPNYMISVPRLYEKIYSTILTQIQGSPAATQKIFNWAQDVGQRVAQKYLVKRKNPTGALAIQYGIAKRLVLKKIQDVFGGELHFTVSGGAPLAKEIGEFFASTGVIILEGYGLTETSPVTNVNRLNDIRFGKVGPPIPQVQMKIADDGEVLFKGPNVMKGYWNNPEETAKVFDEEGWFHSGDIGTVDEDGYLKITDRKKNIIVTSGGKNIAPANIENLLAQSPFIEQIVAIGDRRNYLIALIEPNKEAIEMWAKEKGIDDSYENILKKEELKDVIAKDIAKRQAILPRYEQIKKFLIVQRPFTISNGELTPSLKIKRKVVEDHYKKEIDSLYKENNENL